MKAKNLIVFSIYLAYVSFQIKYRKCKWREGLSRVEEIINYAQIYSNEVRAYYDLYCDHGKVGLALLATGKDIYFNDKAPHLIDKLHKKIGASLKAHFCCVDAKDLTFEKGSMIIAAGVGGLTMIECLKRWKQSHHQDIWEGLTFIFCPAYYDVELRNYLFQNQFYALEEWICEERGRLYDIQVVATRGDRSVGRIPVLLRQENESIYNKYIEKQLKTLKAKRLLSEDEQWYLESYKTILFK